MKSQLFLLFLFSTIFCSPFLKKLEEVTKESCQKEGKEYKETITYRCKTGDSYFNVEKEEDCKPGEWTESTQCSASEVPVEKCQGSPTYTAATTAENAYCELNGVKISSLTTLEACQTTLIWTNDQCSISGVTDENACKTKGKWTSNIETDGSCDLNGKTTKTDCEKKGEWKTDADGNGSCSIEGKNETICNQTSGTWTYNNETDGSCDLSGKTTKSKCETIGTWTKAHCSVDQIKTKEECDGKTPTYHQATEAKPASCKLGDIDIPSRTTEATCEVSLEVKTVGSCSNKNVTKEEDCEAEATVDKVKVAECVDSKSSNSNFLKAINLALFFICLLF